jgi:ketosteroid isomerase-like protein
MPTLDETTVVYQPEVAQQVLAAIEEAEPVTEEPEFISNEDYRELLALAINDAEVWVSQAESLINKIDNGEKIKGTKLNGAVRNGRLEILRSSLTDVKTAKVSG